MRHGESLCFGAFIVHLQGVRVTNIFVIGEGTKPWISLPKGKGNKLTISEERDVKRRQRAAEQ